MNRNAVIRNTAILQKFLNLENFKALKNIKLSENFEKLEKDHLYIHPIKLTVHQN